MNLLIFMIGVLVGILISGSIFVFITLKNDPKPDTDSIKAMKEYIQDLESENEELKERNARLKEAYIRR